MLGLSAPVLELAEGDLVLEKDSPSVFLFELRHNGEIHGAIRSAPDRFPGIPPYWRDSWRDTLSTIDKTQEFLTWYRVARADPRF